MQLRRKTRTVKIGNVKIGGNAPVSIQSMTKTNTEDIAQTVKQIKHLERAGCEIIRVAVENLAAAEAIKKIKKEIAIPLVADIHFNYRLALASLKNGADAIRLNPGNIYKIEHIKQVVELARKQGVVIRVGINGGSLKATPHAAGRTLQARNKTKTKDTEIAELMVESALNYINILEELNFYDIIISLKSSDVWTTIQAYQLMAKRCDYPFHLGVTATGFSQIGLVKSVLGIGTLLAEGMGDTIRVSLTDKPEKEVEVAQDILQSLELRQFRAKIISCPTCSRCSIDLKKITREIHKRLEKADPKNYCHKKIAVMGCMVNGPGEAKEADVGVAGMQGKGVIFKKERIVEKVAEKKIVEVLFKELDLNSE
ncbi:MAG: flavodoxin-dependent (E)-4-hydroxy-3-methylbut-2-enyl-diphosphate synthase [Candidatus Omnitrophica bacterium]|nr:flavodoxin-dependent (E)-4-hydroxy-3-methylbut-2-enyl-diphosphate synthase [Candidatus Omnitrophota bacterium]